MSTTGRRRYRIFWPLALISVGIGLLAAQAGWVSGSALWRLGSLWPVFVILGGVSLILSGYLAPRVAAIALVVCFALGVSSALAFAAFGPDLGGHVATVSASQARGSVAAASLVIDGPAMSVDIRAADTGSSLYTAKVTGDSATAPRVTFDAATATVTVDVSIHGWWSFGFAHGTTVDIAVNRDVSWNVQVNAASVDGTIDMQSSAAKVEVDSAAGDLSMALGVPSGTVPVRLNGASITADITVPQGLPVTVTASGFAAAVAVDGHHTSSVGQSSWTDPGYASATNRYAVEADGASADVTITHDGGVG